MLNSVIWWVVGFFMACCLWVTTESPHENLYKEKTAAIENCEKTLPRNVTCAAKFQAFIVTKQEN